MLTEACRNAVRAVVFMASQDDPSSRHTVREIAASIGGPEAFVAKVLQTMSREGLISASKGPNGGMYLTARQCTRPVLDVVKCIDGLDAFRECGLGLQRCNAQRPCPMHDEYAAMRDALLLSYKNTTIKALADSVRKGEAVLHR